MKKLMKMKLILKLLKMNNLFNEIIFYINKFNFTLPGNADEASEEAHVHICHRQMCLSAPECTHVHICQRQMCLLALECKNLIYFKFKYQDIHLYQKSKKDNVRIIIFFCNVRWLLFIGSNNAYRNIWWHFRRSISN